MTIRYMELFVGEYVERDIRRSSIIENERDKVKLKDNKTYYIFNRYFDWPKDEVILEIEECGNPNYEQPTL